VALIPILWHVEVQAAARRLGGRIRPCTYSVAVGASAPLAALQTQNEEGPFVVTQIYLPDAISDTKTTPLYYDIYAGSRLLTTSQVSDFAIGALAVFGQTIPAPVFLSTAESLVFMRPDADGSAQFQQNYMMGGFHTDAATWENLRRTFKEFRACSVGPRGQFSAGNPVDGPWRRFPKSPMMAKLAYCPVANFSNGNVMRFFQIDNEIVFRDTFIELPSQMRTFMGVDGRTTLFLDRPMREQVLVSRDGTPDAADQILDILGSEL